MGNNEKMFRVKLITSKHYGLLNVFESGKTKELPKKELKFTLGLNDLVGYNPKTGWRKLTPNDLPTNGFFGGNPVIPYVGDTKVFGEV